MPLTDDELLAFDASDYATYEEQNARDALRGEHADAYRVQLVAARWIDGWRQRTAEHDEQSPTDTHPKPWTEGWDKALRELVAHLRQGDLIPGGVLYDEEWGRSEGQ